MIDKGHSNFDKITIMLLGPFKRLEQIKQRLHEDYGYPCENIIIMEVISEDERLIIGKFGDILSNYTPQLFYALFERNTDMGGVIFELGWLCGKYDKLETSKRVRIIADFDYQWRGTTKYIQELIHYGQLLLIDEMTVEVISTYINHNVTLALNDYHES